MDGVVYAGGGFNGAGLENASPGLQARIAAADAMERQSAARTEREHERLVEMRREADIAESVRMAEERGEVVSAKQRMAGIGRTRAEAISYYSALQDIEDARQTAVARKEFDAWTVEQSEAQSADSTMRNADGLRQKIRAWRRRAA